MNVPGKHAVNPIALGPIQDGLAFCVGEGRANISVEKRLENFTLGRPRLFRTRAAATRVLGGQMKCRGAGLVSDCRVGTCIEQTVYRGSAPGAHRAV